MKLAAALLVAFALLGVAVAFAGAVARDPRARRRRTGHRIWIADRIWRHTALFDGDTGDVIGMVDGPSGHGHAEAADARARSRRDLLGRPRVLARHARRARRLRDDLRRPQLLGEGRDRAADATRATRNTSIAYAAMLDGERFLGTFNLFPYASVSIVDLEERRFASEVVIAGCAGIFPTGERRFATLCGGRHRRGGRARRRGQGPRRLPLAALLRSRRGSRHDGGGALGLALGVRLVRGQRARDRLLRRPAAVAASWSLFGPGDRTEHWRVGGLQHLALHADSHRLLLARPPGRARITQGARARSLGVRPRAAAARRSLRASPLHVGLAGPRFGLAPNGWFHRALQRWLPTEGAHSLAVSQDASPLLFVRNAEVGVVAVLDAKRRRAPAQPRRRGQSRVRR
jgi:hypothetical protein